MEINVLKSIYDHVINFKLLTIEACKKDPVHCVWNSWKIGACSKTCGAGTRTNTRTKKVHEKDGGKCSGPSSETKSCFERECPGI